MKEKYRQFYRSFHKGFQDRDPNVYSVLVDDRRVVPNSALKNGIFAMVGVGFWSFGTSCFCPPRKINKNFERKRDPRRGIQRGLSHCPKTLSYP